MRYLKSAYRTVKAFGVRSGCVALAARATAKMAPPSGRKLTRLRLGGWPHPIHVRPGTSDWSVLEQVLISRQYDCPSDGHNQAVNRFYAEALSRTEVPVIIDCGANIGLASIWYAERFPQARVIAIEPEPENYRVLTLNVAGYSNVTAVQGGVSDRETRIRLANAGDEPWGWTTTETEFGDVVTYTIPGLMDGISNSKLMIVKIDIEGSELALFRSNVSWVAAAAVIVFESHDWLFNRRGTFHAVASVLTQHPRDYIQGGENTFSFSHSILSPVARARTPQAASAG